MLLPIIKSHIGKEDLQLKNPGKKISSYLIPCIIVDCEKNGRFKFLVERISGKIISDIQTNQTVDLIDFTELTPNEISLLEYANKVRRFKSSTIPMGLPTHRTDSMIKHLLKLKLLDWTDGNYHIFHAYILRLNPHKFRSEETFENIGDEYLEAQKLEPKVKTEKILQIIESFVNIIKHEEGYILHHYIEK